MTSFNSALAVQDRLQARIAKSRLLYEKVKQHLGAHPACVREGLCIYAAGSLARFETGEISDLDLFFIGNRTPRGAERSISRLAELEAFADLIKINKELELEPFSGDGKFLKVHELDDLISGTGSNDDDSENLFTTRMLLLLESKPLTGFDVYHRSLKSVLEMYFRDGRGRHDFRPLFLLNDILRYWRTLCLNYERTRFEPQKPWWKRNLNLKFSRKLSVFSMVLSIVALRTADADQIAHLAQITPLERLAWALDLMGDQTLLAEFHVVLANYEDFLAAKSHGDFNGNDRLDEFNEKAQHLNDFLHKVLASINLDPHLVRYLMI